MCSREEDIYKQILSEAHKRHPPKGCPHIYLPLHTKWLPKPNYITPSHCPEPFLAIPTLCSPLSHQHSDLFWTRVWCIPVFGAENKSALLHDFLLISAVLRVRERFQNPRQTPVRTKLRLKRFPKHQLFLDLISLNDNCEQWIAESCVYITEMFWEFSSVMRWKNLPSRNCFGTHLVIFCV